MNYIRSFLFVLGISLFSFTNKAYAQCGAINFFATDTVICAPSFTQFFVQNLPAGASVFWDFGDGTLAGNTSPNRFYQAPGNYTVKLQVTLVNNATCEIEKQQYIKARPKPEINVGWDKPRLCFGPDSVTFFDSSLNIKSRDYLFGNTLISNAPKQFTRYFDSVAGIKSLIVFATDSFGCRNIKSYDTAVYQYWGFDSLGMDIRFTPSNVTCAPARVTFLRDLPNPANHVLQSYSWVATGPTTITSAASQPTLVLPQGKYDVTHTFTNTGGCSYSITKEEWIEVFDSIAPQISVDKTAVCAGEEVLFTLTNGNPAAKVSWNFGNTPATILYQDSVKVRVAFNQIGTAGPTLVYTNNTCNVQKSFPGMVAVNGPNPLFTLPITHSCVLPVQARAINTSDLTGAGPTDYLWQVINQKTQQVVFSATQSDSIVFTLSDTANYSIKLRTIGSNGCTDSLVIKDAIIIDSLYPAFSISPALPCPGEPVTLEATSIEATTGIKNRHYWEVYNLNGVSLLASDTTEKWTVNFPDTGRYSIYLKGFTPQGCAGSKLFVDTLRVASPVVSFSISDSLPCRMKPFTVYSSFDSKDFPGYTTRWILQHTDTNLVVFSAINRDSQAFVLSHPGRYRVRFVYSSANNRCRDTLDAPFSVRVSGIRVSLTTNDPLFGCEPLTVNWRANSLGNYNFINALPHQYEWKVPQNMAGSNTTFSPSTGMQTTATYPRKGINRSMFIANHGSGCIDTFYTPSFVTGSTADFGLPSSIRCVNSTSQLSNGSLNATTFKWESNDPTAIVFTPNDTMRNPNVTVLKEGDFVITLYAIGPQGCRDTARRTVRVINPKADFNSSDTVQFCAPVLSTFTPTPVWYGNEYRWYFGDGDSFTTTKASSVSHVYKKNTDSAGLNVRLVVRTPGCLDTMDKFGYVKVIGPVPNYSFTITQGCEPLRVDFVNTSKNYSRFFFEYGDGNALDSTSFGNYAYRVMDKSFNAQCYKTRLVLVDGNDCYAVEEDPRQICVRKSPEPNFTTTDTLGCDLYTVNFTNQTTYGISFKWDYEGTGNFVDAQGFNAQYFYSKGLYRPRLAAFNVNGCSDTTPVNKLRIWSQPKPQASFVPASDSICFNTPLSFNSTSTASVKITSHFWDFGDPASNRDTSSKVNPSYSYLSPLLKQVQLVVADSNKCRDTFSRFVHVLDTVPPQNRGLHYVTIQDNKDILGVWPQSTVGRFQSYAFYEDETGYTKLYETNQRTDTSFLVTTGINVQNKRNCYTLTTSDTCGHVSRHSQPHCTITASVQASGNAGLLVSWIRYVGWNLDDFWGYIVYRSKQGGPFIPIDTVNNTTDFYLDKDLCELSYCYYVEAVHNNRVFRSVSNRVCETPNYVYPTDPALLVRASVLSSNAIIVEWEKYTAMDNLKHYRLSRLQSDNNQLIDSLSSTSDLFFIDNQVNTSQTSYEYTLRPLDKCGYSAPISSHAKTILLRNKMKNYLAYLTWNAYSFWPEGVSHYVVERKNVFGGFDFIALLPGDSLNYIYNGLQINDNRDVCMRVYAVRNGRTDTSYSNLSCDFPESQIYAPTAFSPNGDGLNDVFKPSAVFVQNQPENRLLRYELHVFDRWGNRLFTSYDLETGWDGTYASAQVPQGVYMYTLKAVGLDGKIYDFKGTLHLIR